MPTNATSQEINVLVGSTTKLIADLAAKNATLKEVSAYIGNLSKIFNRLAHEDNHLERTTWHKMNTALKQLKDAVYGTVAQRSSDDHEKKELRVLVNLECEAAIMKLKVFAQTDESLLTSSKAPNRAPPAPPVANNQYGQLPGDMKPKAFVPVATSASASTSNNAYGFIPGEPPKDVTAKASVVHASSAKQTTAHLPGSVDPQIEAARIKALDQATKDLEALLDEPKGPTYGQIPKVPLDMRHGGGLANSNAPKASRAARTGAGDVAKLMKEEAEKDQAANSATTQSEQHNETVKK